MVAQYACKEPGGFLDAAVESETLRLEGAFARQRQQPAIEPAALLGSIESSFYKTACRVVGDAILGEFEVPCDDGQKIVEIMCDTPGKLTHSLQATRICEHFLVVLAFAQVSQDASEKAPAFAIPPFRDRDIERYLSSRSCAALLPP